MNQRARLLGHATVNRLVDFTTGTAQDHTGADHDITTGTVKDFRSIARLHQVLIQDGFQLHQNEVFGPPGGRQLFYVQDTTRFQADPRPHRPARPVMDGILVRIKTCGNRRPPRQGQPHMSICFYTAGTGWDQERAKFDVYGQVTPRSPSRIAPVLSAHIWAHACHFVFRPGFDFSAAGALMPGNYAIREALWRATRP